jgi:predicted PurR-regulated permease PerM
MATCTNGAGHILRPWSTVRATRMSPVVVFVGVLSWGWPRGVGGLLFGLPILKAVKAVCDRVDELKAVDERLGD